jgi:hypothetical protein
VVLAGDGRPSYDELAALVVRQAAVIEELRVASVQYGPQVTAMVVYLYVGQFLSKKRTAQALAELFGTPLCRNRLPR